MQDVLYVFKVTCSREIYFTQLYDKIRRTHLVLRVFKWILHVHWSQITAKCIMITPTHASINDMSIQCGDGMFFHCCVNSLHAWNKKCTFTSIKIRHKLITALFYVGTFDYGTFDQVYLRRESGTILRNDWVTIQPDSTDSFWEISE